MERRLWTRDQLVKVLAMYCQIPFGKMHARNPVVIAFAKSIKRTPSAVALKLVNFASLDPELKARGVSGMGNVSQSDKHIWEEFHGRWEVLADVCDFDVVLEVQSTLRGKRRIQASIPAGFTETRREVKVRRGQSFFRGAVLAAHEWMCCITGITTLELLRASHIIPWSHDLISRLNPRNGLCLNALHDAAFDCGLITLSANFELQISKRLKNEVPAKVYEEMFERWVGTSARMPKRFAPIPEMLEYHRANIFCP